MRTRSQRGIAVETDEKLSRPSFHCEELPGGQGGTTAVVWNKGVDISRGSCFGTFAAVLMYACLGTFSHSEPMNSRCTTRCRRLRCMPWRCTNCSVPTCGVPWFPTVHVSHVVPKCACMSRVDVVTKSRESTPKLSFPENRSELCLCCRGLKSVGVIHGPRHPRPRLRR